MQIRSGRWDGVDLRDIPKEDLLKIVAGSTNAGSPFTSKEIEAVKGEIDARTVAEPKPPEPLKSTSRSETKAEAKARAKAEAKADAAEDDEDDEDDSKDDDGDD